MRVNATKEVFEKVTVFGLPMLFTCLRIDRDTVPDGLYVYEVRHDDDCQGIPAQIARFVMVNHWGTLISKTELNLEPSTISSNAYLDIEEDEWNYGGVSMTLDEYMKEV